MEGGDYIPRYAEYARSQGRTAAAQAAHDRESALRMIPYMHWCAARLGEWRAIVGLQARWPVVPPMSAADHAAFDAWLATRPPAGED